MTGYALAPPTIPSLFEDAGIRELLTQSFTGDVRELKPLSAALDAANPDISFHLAAQSLVRESYADPVGTLGTNVMGTVNLLEAVRLRHKPCVVVIVTSDKCYANSGQVGGIASAMRWAVMIRTARAKGPPSSPRTPIASLTFPPVHCALTV